MSRSGTKFSGLMADEVRELAATYASIEDPALRTHIRSLIAQLAEQHGPDRSLAAQARQPALTH